MKKYLLALLLLLPFAAQADDVLDFTIDPFISSYTDASGVKFAMSGGESWRWRGEVTYADRLPSLGGGFGYKWENDFQLYLTANKVRNGETPAAPINFEPTQPHDRHISMTDGEGYSLNLEADYKWVFVRYTYYDLDHDYAVSTVNPTPPPLYLNTDQGKVNTTNDMWMIGIRIPII